MAICEDIGQESVCLPRADTIRRWAAEGSRAFAKVPRVPVHLPHRSNSILDRRSWFGSNGERVGYTPKGVNELLASQSQSQSPSVFRHGIVAAIVQHFAVRFERIKVKRACQILRRLGCGDDVFLWGVKKGSENGWTPNEILKPQLDSKCDSEYSCDRCAVAKCGMQFQNWFAHTIFPINFIGGPPDKWRIYYGSLRTLMLDRIAVMVLFEGIGTLDGIIGFSEKYTRHT